VCTIKAGTGPPMIAKVDVHIIRRTCRRESSAGSSRVLGTTTQYTENRLCTTPARLSYSQAGW
jgi:hypothetical protein